jgi:hypothetical protein
MDDFITIISYRISDNSNINSEVDKILSILKNYSNLILCIQNLNFDMKTLLIKTLSFNRAKIYKNMNYKLYDYSESKKHFLLLSNSNNGNRFNYINTSFLNNYDTSYNEINMLNKLGTFNHNPYAKFIKESLNTNIWKQTSLFCSNNKHDDLDNDLLYDMPKWFNLSNPLVENIRSSLNYLVENISFCNSDINYFKKNKKNVTSPWIYLYDNATKKWIVLLIVDLKESNDKDIQFLYILQDFLAKSEDLKSLNINFNVFIVGEFCANSINYNVIDTLPNIYDKKPLLEKFKNIFKSNETDKQEMINYNNIYLYNKELLKIIKTNITNSNIRDIKQLSYKPASNYIISNTMQGGGFSISHPFTFFYYDYIPEKEKNTTGGLNKYVNYILGP